MKRKIGEVLKEIDSLVKEGFIPNPNTAKQQQGQDPSAQQGQPQPGGDPGGGQQQPPQDPSAQQGQQGGGQDMQAMISQLPPEVQQQLSQLPPEQQQQLLQQAQGGQGGQEGQLPDSEQLHVSQVQSSGPPTDMEKSTVTLRLRDLLDLVSGGKATQSTLKVQDHYSKQQQRQQQQQQKLQADEQKRQQEAQMQQQMGAGGGGGMLGGGGIY